jgi:hypothetical protein
MGYYKDLLIEEQWLEEHLCRVCEDRMREVGCIRCAEPTICRFCSEQGHSSLCAYCDHVAYKAMHEDD